MASELAGQILDAGFPAAKPVRDHDLFGIPTLEELIAAVEQLRPEFRLSVRRINPDEWEAHSGFVTIDGEVTYWARHGSTATEALAKIWLALHAVQYERESSSFRTLPHNTERRSPTDKVTGRGNPPTARCPAYRAEPATTSRS